MAFTPYNEAKGNGDGVRCENCPFKGTPRRVGSRGPIDSPFVIVGEGPGAIELTKRAPFVGPSGKMLDEVLRRCGLDDIDVDPYITNAMCCYPGNEKNEESLNTGARACQSRLLTELQAHPRKVILTLGSAAMRATLGNFDMKVTRDRGKVYQSPLASEGVVVAVHPAYVMRNGTAFPQWQEDIRLAVSRLRGWKPEPWVDPTWSTIRTRKQLFKFIRTFFQSVDPGDDVTCDFETDSLNSITGRILELGITWGDANHVFMITEECFYENPDLMKLLMETKKVKWNWHNGKFDIRWGWRIGVRMRVDNDTMMLSYALNENGGMHDLDQVAEDHLQAPNHKGMLKPYLPNKKTSYRVIPAHVRREYAAKDVKKTHLLLPVLLDQVVNDRHLNKVYHEIMIPSCNAICEVEEYGVEVDLEQVAKNQKRLDFQLWLMDSCLDYFARQYHMGGMNFGSWQQLQELLYTRMKLGPIGSSTNEKTLIDFQRITNHPIFDVLMKRREIAKEGGTYVNNMHKHIHPDGCVHITYKMHGTSTGRPAAEGPNLLNQPRKPDIRNQYKARKGKIFAEVDLNQAELRSLAVMSGDPVLIDIYTKNEVSIHDVTTGEMFASKAVLKESISERHRVAHLLGVSAYSDIDYLYHEAKMRGKAVNFGIVYGREAASLAKEFDIPIAEAARWIQAWFNKYKVAKKFIDRCRKAPAEMRTLITPYGRKKRWGCVAGEALIGLMNEAANFPHQSFASDIMMETFIKVQPVLKERWDAHIWLELYDAIYFEVDDDPVKLAQAVNYVQEVIPTIAPARGVSRVPFIGDAKTGYSWGNMHEYVPPKELLLAA